MITEDYVSFETAKLLKEKGFNKYPIFPCYKEDDSKLFIDIPTTLDTIHYHFIPAPTIQMAMKWLREVHKLEIYPFHDTLQGSAWWYRIERNTGLVEKEEDAIYGTYEEACESAIKYCLENLI